MLKRFIKISYSVFAGLIGLVMLLYFLLNTMVVQNYLCQRLVSYVNNTYHTRISIGELSYDGWSFVSLRHVMLGDTRQDTLFYVGRLQLNLAGLALDSSRVRLRDVVLDEPLAKLQTYSDSVSSLAVFDLFPAGDTTVKSTQPFVMEIRNLEVMDARFVLNDSLEPFINKGFDPFHFCFFNANFRSKKFTIVNDSLSFDIRNMSAQEKGGLELLRMKAKVTVSPKAIAAEDLDLLTQKSHVRNSFAMLTKSWDDYTDDFFNLVKFKISLDNSVVDINDMAYFIPPLEGYHYAMQVDADANGPLSDLRFKRVRMQMGEQTRFKGEMTITGLPNIEETFMDVEVDHAASIAADLEKLAGMSMPQAVKDFGLMTYSGRFTGFYSDFVGYGNITTPFGSARTDLNLKFGADQPQYSGALHLQGFQLGSYLQRNDLGVLDLSGDIKGEGFDLDHLKSEFNLQVGAVNYDGYTYRDLALKGNVEHRQLALKMEVLDSNLMLNATLNAGLGEGYKHLQLKGTLDRSELKALGLNPEAIRLGARVEADYYVKDLNNHYGYVQVDDLHYEKAGYTYRVNQLRLESVTGKEEALSLNGDFIKAQLKGQYDFKELYSQVRYWTRSLGSNFFPATAVPDHPQDFTFSVNLSGTNSISPLLFPGLNISYAEVKGGVNSSEESWQAAGHITSASYGGFNLNQLTFKADEKMRQTGNLLLGFRSLLRHDTLLVGDFALKANAESNRCKLQYQVMDTASLLQLKFAHVLQFMDNKVAFDLEPSWVQSGSSRWQLDTGMHVILEPNQIVFDQMELVNGNQELQLDGYYQFSGLAKNISLKLRELDLNTLNQYAKGLDLTVHGKANGFLVYKNMERRDVVIGEVGLTALRLDNDTLGDFELAIGYREAREDLLIDFRSVNSKINALRGSGTYAIRDRFLNMDLSFEELRVNAFQAFIKDYVQLYEGDVSMNAKLSGHPEQLKLGGKLEVTDVVFKVDYLQTKYSLKHAVMALEDEVIRIQPCLLTDNNKQTAQVEGEIRHDGFTRFDYDLRAGGFKAFQLLNTTSRDNELFFGSAYGSGKFRMKGDLNNVDIYVDAITDKGTKVIVNPFGASAESGESYIRFMDHDTVMAYERTGKGSDVKVGVYLNIVANPDAEVQVVFDARSDDRIRARGNSNMRMEYLPSGDFRMIGDFVLSEGEYRFSAMNVVAKKFNLKQGSSIHWTGDPLSGQMDIAGIYKLKSAISPIVNMTNSPDPNVRIPVECLINIKGKLEKPEITFDLNFPDLQNTITGNAASELSAVVNNFRREPEMMNQQILFLLISGGFVPITNTYANQTAGISNQTVSDLLSRQAAGLIGKAVPNIDVSVDLLNSTDPTKSRTVLLSASKKFLDNRLEVQTSYAIDQTQTNFAATYNLRKSEGTKVKIFNKSGFDALFNRNVVTSGAGLYYRKSFDNFGDFFKQKSAN